MIALAETLSSPSIRLHSPVSADFHARVVVEEGDEDEEEDEEEESWPLLLLLPSSSSSSRRWRNLKAKTSRAPPRQPEAKVAK